MDRVQRRADRRKDALRGAAGGPLRHSLAAVQVRQTPIAALGHGFRLCLQGLCRVLVAPVHLRPADAYADGLIGCKPHFNSDSNYIVKPELAGILKELVTLSSLPLKPVETDFAVDSWGFSTSRYVTWFNKKHGRQTDNREWVKVHLMCGARTKIVTGVDVSACTAHDTNYFSPLI